MTVTPAPTHGPKTAFHAFRATADEGACLRQAAAERELTISDLIREGLRAIGALPPPGGCDGLR